MNNLEFKQYILPLYLAVVVLLQLELSVQNVLLAGFPIVLIMISIYLRNKKLGIICMFLFYTLSLSQIIVINMEDFFLVFLELFFLVLPSIMLLNQILQLENKQVVFFSTNKKPLIIAVCLFVIITSIFYYLSIASLEGFILASESTPGQVLLLTGLSIVCCVPFLVIQKNNT